MKIKYLVSRTLNILNRRQAEEEYLTKWQESLLVDLCEHFNRDESDIGVNKYLDIGTTDNAYPVIEMGKKGFQSIGFNIKTSVIQNIVSNQKKNHIVKYPGTINFIVGDAAAIPFKEGIFESLSCISTFEHISDCDTAIREMGRVMKKGGRLFILVPNNYREMPFIARWLYKTIDEAWVEHKHYEKSNIAEMFRNIGDFDLITFGYRGHLAKIVQELIKLLTLNNKRFDKLWWKLENIDKRMTYNTHAVHLWMVFCKR